MRGIWGLAAVAAAVLVLAGCAAEPTPLATPPASTAAEPAVTIDSVVDGDTIETSAGTVRIIGIDAPERGECCVFITIPQGQFSSGTGACAIAPFDPQLDLALATYAGSEIADAFGADAVLRLRVVGDELRVFVAHEPAGTGA